MRIRNGCEEIKMTSKIFWQSWLLSPAILGATLVTSSAVLAKDGAFVPQSVEIAPEKPLVTITAQPPTVASSVAATTPMIADLLKSQPENLVALDTEGSVPAKEVPGEVRDAEIVEQINRYSNESEANSHELVHNNSQLGNSSPNQVDASDAGLIGQINEYNNESGTDPLDQVTNVSQLRDVSPGDWAFEALRSLVERYGCIAGYPDGTYRVNRALSRYEFAAGLNACLQQVER